MVGIRPRTEHGFLAHSHVLREGISLVVDLTAHFGVGGRRCSPILSAVELSPQANSGLRALECVLTTREEGAKTTSVPGNDKQFHPASSSYSELI